MRKNTGGLFLKSLIKFSVASWIQAIIAFISIPIITRTFSPGEYGKINMFTLATGLISMVVGLAMDQSYVRFFNDNETDDSRRVMLTQLIASTSLIYLAYIILNTSLGEVLSRYLFDEYNKIIIYVAFPVMILMTIISKYQKLYFRMKENALAYGIISVLGVVASKLVLVIAAFIYPSYSLGILLSVFAFTLLVSGCFFISKKSFDINVPIIKIHQLLPYLKYSLPLLPVAIIVFFNSSIVRFLLKDYLSFEALGIFAASASVVNLLSIIQSGFIIYWAPFMFDNYKQEQDLIKKIHSAISMILISFALIIILFSDVVFYILGEEYRSGRDIFALLLFSPVALTISETTVYGIYINKKTHLQFYSTLVSFASTIILSIFLIPRFGLLGAAVTNAISGLIFFLLRTYFGIKEYSSVEKLYRTYISLGLLLLAGLINYYLSFSIFFRSMFVLIILIIILIIYRDILGRLKILIFNLRIKLKRKSINIDKNDRFLSDDN